jgi:hypothetical protein
MPEEISKHAAISDERPIPARQWIATEPPSCTEAAKARASRRIVCRGSGTPRSRIGQEMKIDPAPSAESGFVLQGEFRNLLGLQQAHDDIDTEVLPVFDLRLEPVAGARPRHDRDPSVRLKVDPIQS